MPTRQAPIIILIMQVISCSLAPGCSKPIPRSPEGLEPAEVVSAFLRLSRDQRAERALEFCTPDSVRVNVENYWRSLAFMEAVAETETGSSRLHIDPEDFTAEINGDTAYATMKDKIGGHTIQFECRLIDGVWLFHTPAAD